MLEQRLLFWSLVSLAAPAIAAAQCETAPAHPDPPPAVEKARGAPYETARHIEGYEDAFLGVGHLEPEGADHYYDWHEYVTIPLYRAPLEEHVGWIRDGWVMLVGSERKPFTYAGTTETEYERATLIILEEQDDGWIRIRYDGTGTAWTHRCTLSLGEVSLSVRLWRDLFTSEEARPLYYRKRVRHSLRAGPDVSSERVAWIGADDEVEAIEIRGVWMRVTVYQPGKFLWKCSGEGLWQGATRTGWIRWWDEEKGPWLYWHTRGC